MNLCPLCPPSHTLLDLPHSPTHTQTHRPHAFVNSEAGRGRVARGNGLFRSDPPGQVQEPRAETERWRETGRVRIYVQCEVEDGGWRKASQFALWVSLFFPPLQPHAGRHSRRFFLCGPELRVIPKQSALIQGLRGLERSAAREPSPWPALTHATLDTLYAR